ncbi:MAG: SET domain-containing protein-lysine N-methyltransferase [Acidobacteriaceae bacterium]
MGLIICSSTIHAAGCYTTAPIRKGQRVVEYTGPLIDKEQADLLYADRPITSLFGIGDGTQVIDGHGTAMFINHSCDANCETEEIDARVWIMAIRDIAAGEELCYDYCLYDGDEEEAPCNCGARTCRGTMFSPEELKRRKRLEKKTAARPGVKPTRKKQPVKKQPLKPRKPARTKKKSPAPAKTKHVKKASEKKSPKKIQK